MNNQEFESKIDEQIATTEKILKDALWTTEVIREKLIQLKVQKTNLFLAGEIGNCK